MIKSIGSKTDSWRTSLITGLHMDIELLTMISAVAIQSTPYPLNSPPIQSISVQFSYTDVLQDHIKGLTEIHCSVFSCQLTQLLHHRRPSDWSSIICPWWSYAGCLISYLCLSCALTVLPEESAPGSSRAQGRGSPAWSSLTLPFSLSWKWECCFLQSPETWPDSHDFLNVMAWQLHQPVFSVPWGWALCLIHIQFHWTCSLLTVGRMLLPQSPPRSSGTLEMREAWLLVKTEAKK